MDSESGRAGSAGGIVLEKEQRAKKSTKASTEKPATNPPPSPAVKGTAPEVGSAVNKPRRKPRKLNKEPISTSTVEPKTGESPSELEALKSRVRGLEAKVEDLYKTSSADTRPARSPRRRGKGRKGSSTTQVPTISTTNAAKNSTAKVQELDDDVEEQEEAADEELVRLEGELEVARQDLEAYRPRTNGRTVSQEDDDEDDVEEIPRGGGDGTTAGNESNNRHVTLSGSYRIPLPTNVSLDDVKTIQSGVSAAQNVARGFLEQRRAAATLREQQNPSPKPKASTPSSSQSASSAPKPKRPSGPRAVSSSMEVAVDNSGGKQSWSEWIGGYSVAISRAVNKIEHEAAVESQNVGSGSGSAGGSAGAGSRRTAAAGRTVNANANALATTKKKSAGGTKKVGTKAKGSSGEMQGLMS
ncbi:hypothetical protein N0V83_010465 [Neocucurbitaria cava]|uniref:Uncharacterized protein n=1 Tax=Neocucurbitaria cava TaxID=798079 RepID=A0A9W8XXK4_9PLEO|nr:hypothetical protein N0V83_010465 [Neocucurbitaria cava]